MDEYTCRAVSSRAPVTDGIKMALLLSVGVRTAYQTHGRTTGQRRCVGCVLSEADTEKKLEAYANY